ncbi:unnamed protein product, partial [Prunus brigantina]
GVFAFKNIHKWGSSAWSRAARVPSVLSVGGLDGTRESTTQGSMGALSLPRRGAGCCGQSGFPVCRYGSGLVSMGRGLVIDGMVGSVERGSCQGGGA